MARMLARVVLLFCALLPSVASGQYYDWGRSPQGMRWMQAKLPSGKVVFPDYYSDNAARVARYLDTIRPSISYGFEYAPLKMPVVLHTENFVANGMAMWAPKRIELEMIPDAQPFAEPWLKHLVTHEYRHARTVRQSVPPFYEGARVRARTTGRFRQFGARSGLVSRGRRRDGRNSDVVVRARASAVVYGRVPGLSDRGEAAVSARPSGSAGRTGTIFPTITSSAISWWPGRGSGTATTCGRAWPITGRGVRIRS